MPLLLLVVGVLGNQACTTTAAPVVSDPHVSLDATPPRLLPRSTDRSSSSSSSSSILSSSSFPSSFRRAIYKGRFSNHHPENPTYESASKGELDYHEVSLLPGEREDPNGLDGDRLLSAWERTRIDTIGRKDPSSPVAAGGRGGEGSEGGGKRGRGGGGLAHERTKSRRRQVAADRKSVV